MKNESTVSAGQKSPPPDYLRRLTGSRFFFNFSALFFGAGWFGWQHLDGVAGSIAAAWIFFDLMLAPGPWEWYFPLDFVLLAAILANPIFYWQRQSHAKKNQPPPRPSLWRALAWAFIPGIALILFQMFWFPVMPRPSRMRLILGIGMVDAFSQQATWNMYQRLAGAGWDLALTSHFSSALAHQNMALAWIRLRFGPNHPFTLDALNQTIYLALLVEDFVKADEASAHFARLTKRIFGPRHFYSLAADANQGMIWLSKGKYMDARRTLRNTFMELEKTPMPNEAAMTFQSIAGITYAYGWMQLVFAEWGEAETTLWQALNIMTQVQGGLGAPCVPILEKLVCCNSNGFTMVDFG